MLIHTEAVAGKLFNWKRVIYKYDLYKKQWENKFIYCSVKAACFNARCQVTSKTQGPEVFLLGKKGLCNGCANTFSLMNRKYII